MPVYFITGASRGIGLETATQLLQHADNTVFATARNPGAPLTELKGQGTLHVFQCDVVDEASVKACAEQVRSMTDRIDYLFNNAAITMKGDNPSTLSIADFRHMMSCNVESIIMVSQALESLFRDGTVIVNFTSGLGSISLTLSTTGVMSTGYSITKAAVNMFTAKQACHYGPQGVIPICLNPGWVKTDMGGPGAALEVSDSVKQILNTVHSVKKDDAGKFLRFNGDTMDW